MAIIRDKTRFTSEQLELLADIFRILIKEVNTDRDVEKLAPGELGINYTTGCLYIRHPRTNKLITPNSSPYLQLIERIFDENTGESNVDRVGGIKFITELEEIGLDDGATVDMIIANMPDYCTLSSYIAKPNGYASLGFPSSYGILNVFKLSADVIKVTFFDIFESVSYTGRYSPTTHVFTGWITYESIYNHKVRSTSGGDNLSIEVPDIADLDVIKVVVTADINTESTVTINGKEYELLNLSSKPLDTIVMSNMDIILVYDAVEGVVQYTFTPYGVNAIMMNIVKKRTASLLSFESRLTAIEKAYTESN